MTGSDIEIIGYILKNEVQGMKIGDQLLLLLIEAVVVWFVGKVISRKRSISIRKLVHIYLMIAYMGILFSLTIFRRTEGSREGIVNLFINMGFGFRTGRLSLFASILSILNILLFVPVGILTCPLVKSESKLKKIIISTLIGACLSFFIEMIQLITGRGMFETTDLLTNTLGSFIGALLYESVTCKQVSVS